MKVLEPIKLQGYVIYNPATKLFSSGGTTVKWRKKGKIWSGIGPLKNHLNLYVSTCYGYGFNYSREKGIHIGSVYDGCQIIDVTTGQPIDLSIDEIMLTRAKSIKSKHYYKDYPIFKDGQPLT